MQHVSNQNTRLPGEGLFPPTAQCFQYCLPKTNASVFKEGQQPYFEVGLVGANRALVSGTICFTGELVIQADDLKYDPGAFTMSCQSGSHSVIESLVEKTGLPFRPEVVQNNDRYAKVVEAFIPAYANAHSTFQTKFGMPGIMPNDASTMFAFKRRYRKDASTNNVTKLEYVWDFCVPLFCA